LRNLVVEALLNVLDEILGAGHVSVGTEVLVASDLVVELDDLGVEHLEGRGSVGVVEAVAQPQGSKVGTRDVSEEAGVGGRGVRVASVGEQQSLEATAEGELD
jgi:hypothetical protein